MRRLALTVFVVFLLPALPGYSQFPSECGDPPPSILALLPQCGIVIPVLQAPVTFGGGLWHGRCRVDVYNADGDPDDDYSFDWLGATATTSPSTARPNNCECQKMNDNIHLCATPIERCTVIQEGDCDTSPIVVSLSGVIRLTGGPVSFDVDADGTPDRIGWTGPNTAFLALDRDGDGLIEDGTELFGTATPEAAGGNGYAALSAFDNDGNEWVTAAEMPALQMWLDSDADGVTGPGELRSAWSHLSAVGVDDRDGRRTDAFGNRYAWWAPALLSNGTLRRTVDVLFVRVP